MVTRLGPVPIKISTGNLFSLKHQKRPQKLLLVLARNLVTSLTFSTVLFVNVQAPSLAWKVLLLLFDSSVANVWPYVLFKFSACTLWLKTRRV